MLRSELAETKRRLLEGQLANGRMDEDLRRLREEIRRLRSQLDDEEGKSRKLRIELMESRLSSLRNPPTLHNEGVGSVTSLPDLNQDGRGQERWTTSSFTLGGEQPDLSELIEKHREVTRLNKELQKKCEERLRTSSGGRERGGGGTTSDRERSYWESRIREAESKGRREKREQEKLFNTRVRLLEEKLIESEKRRKILEEQLESAIQKEEEIERYKNIYLFVYLFVCLFVYLFSLVTSLQTADEKKRLLEIKLEEILTEKNNKISELEQRIIELQENQVGEMEKERMNMF